MNRITKTEIQSCMVDPYYYNSEWFNKSYHIGDRSDYMDCYVRPNHYLYNIGDEGINKVNHKTTDNGGQIEIILPGFNINEIEIYTISENLHVVAKTNRDVSNICQNYFLKSFEIKNIDDNTIIAKLENGVLVIDYSFLKPINEKKHIKINQ